MFGFDYASFLSWQLCGGGFLLGLGLLLGFLFLSAVSSGGLVRIPDGENPPDTYKRWKESSIKNRIGKKGFLIAGLAIGFLVIGIGIVIYGLNS